MTLRKVNGLATRASTLTLSSAFGLLLVACAPEQFEENDISADDAETLESVDSQETPGTDGVQPTPDEAHSDDREPIPDEAHSDDSELVEKGFVQYSAQSSAEIYRAVKGERDVVMRPASTHHCFLTRVSGDMRNTEAVAGVHQSPWDVYAMGPLPGGYPMDANNNWKLVAYNESSNSITADAVCVPKSAFTLDPGMVIWQSPLFHTTTPVYWSGIGWEPAGSGTGTVDMWLGDAISHLSYVRGWFQGTGEYARITDGAANTPTTLGVRNQNRGFVEAQARSLFVGFPGQTVTRRTAAYSSSGNKTTRLINTRAGVCYLHRITGDFNGSEERVRIYPAIASNGIEYWMFETHAGGGSVQATAQCVYYWQSLHGYCDTNYCG